MKRTLLLSPPCFKDFDGGAGSRYQATREVTSFWYPTWLCYPAGLITESRVLDAPPLNLRVAEVVKQAADYELVVIFTSSASLTHDIKTVEALKASYPNLTVGMVGPQVTVLPDQALDASPALDFVARREFDYTVLELAEGRRWEKILGLSYRKNGKIYHNPDRPWIEDLDALPWVTEIYHRDLDINLYHIPYLRDPYISIYSGRGCPHHCIYCLWPQTLSGHRYRVRSVADVVNEVRRSLELFPQAAEIFFDDDTFTANPERVRQLSREFRPLQFTWSATARVNTDYKSLKAMKEGGLRLLVVGYETGNEQILKNIRKGATLDQARRFTRWCKELGIQIHGTFIVGLPGETPATIEESIRFACDLDPDTIQVSLATPYPGTAFYDLCITQSYFRSEFLVDGDTGYQQCVVEYPELKAEEIFQAVPRFYRKFYFRPGYMARTAKTMLLDADERRRLLKEGKEFFGFLFRRNQPSHSGTEESLKSSIP
ncbi:MAG: hopanoid biosynthesis associated radical SAM protein HpnJ [Deltaproteobacteria bacterium]|nr:hopanoid biosynthesis associated radical SAM protein HpnJ [Deltaproteobacteria bacterium]MBW2134488.1 hopanoid biosynthesis associated radical SAM protein HpnJ [Deltaproteobacteria bacterium]